MIATAGLTRIARVLVFRCDGLDEANRIQFAFRGGSDHKTRELLFVTQMRAPRRAGRVRRIVVERIVMELKLPVWTEGKGRVRARVRISAVRTAAIRPAGRTYITARVRPAT